MRSRALAAGLLVSACFNPDGGEGGSEATTAATSSPVTSGEATGGEATSESTSGESTTLPDAETSDAATTGAAPACGDGAVDPGEDCDDGNATAGDGCSDSCTRDAWLVFVTRDRYEAGFEGLTGADELCTALAGAAGLPGERWVAWLSAMNDDAAARLGPSTLPFVRTDGVQVVADADALAKGELVAPIDHDQDGSSLRADSGDCGDPEAVVFTGTDEAGGEAELTCGGWEKPQIGEEGYAGLWGATDTTWTFACPIDCGVAARLYCFEVPAVG